jgi:ribosomal protein L32
MMQRKTGEIKCWNCGKWITKKGNLCPYCGKNKEKSRQMVETREDRFISISVIWLIVALLLSVVSWVIVGSPIAFCGTGLLLFGSGLIISYFGTGMAGA